MRHGISAARQLQARNSGRSREAIADELDAQPVQVVDPPHIRGPYRVPGNPIMVRYEIAARLRLPAADSPAAPSISYVEAPEDGTWVDIRWTTTDSREPRGVWERQTVITLPRQFVVKAYTVTGSETLPVREDGR